MSMLAGRKNRGRHGGQECSYGCCRTLDHSKRTRRIIRKREKRQWRKEQT